jgi:hypothetical protein
MGGTYRKAYRPPLPRRSRTLPIHGTGDDADRYYHCWFCGFVCDADRDELGGSDSPSGVGHTEAMDLACDNSPESICKSTLGGDVNCFEVGMRLGQDDSTPLEVVHNHKCDISSGCPFCGSKNWRGDY